MTDGTAIEWTHRPGTKGETWNPIAGCSLASPGCTNCYAMRRVAPRLSGNPATPHYAGTVQPSKGGPVWTGKIGVAADAVVSKPLRWTSPRTIFVNSTSDLFHEGVPDKVIDRVFAVMTLCPQHTFMVLTKRAERMREYMTNKGPSLQDMAMVPKIGRKVRVANTDWPLPNVWLGVSVEDQTRADERIPHLLATPAAVRFVSAEPLIGPVHFGYLGWPKEGGPTKRTGMSALTGAQYIAGNYVGSLPRLDWIIVGGESGPGARPFNPDWARSARDQCKAANVAFFMKQMGGARKPFPPIPDDLNVKEFPR